MACSTGPHQNFLVGKERGKQRREERGNKEEEREEKGEKGREAAAQMPEVEELFR